MLDEEFWDLYGFKKLEIEFLLEIIYQIILKRE
jgi:hypothetical protein